MSRRHAAEKREVQPDAKFGSEELSKFMNYVMEDGKKSVAEKIVYGALEIASKEAKEEQLVVFEVAISNIKPKVEVRSKRVGGATYQVPVEVSERRATILAYRWLVECSRKRSENTMKERLAKEIVASFNKNGSAMKKREDTHKMAEANKAFSHFRF